MVGGGLILKDMLMGEKKRSMNSVLKLTVNRSRFHIIFQIGKQFHRKEGGKLG